MFAKKTVAFLFSLTCFCLDAHLVRAQEFTSQPNLSKHTSGFIISYAYPKLAAGTKRRNVTSGFNYGVSGSFEWGKYYDSGISFMIAPQLYYSKLRASKIQYKQYNALTGKLKVVYEEEFETSELEFVLPIAYEFPIFKSFRLSAGADFSIPLLSSGSKTTRSYDNRDPPKIKNEYIRDFENVFNAGIGVNGKVLYQLSHHENIASYLAFEYWYMVSYFNDFSGHKTRFAISYVHRHIQVKEVRQKWDRYWIKKDRQKN